jgi:hypothetical protein
MCDCGEVSDEAAVEIAESQEASDVFNGSWSRPFCDSFYFHGIHLDLSLTDNDAEIFHLFLVKGAFLSF